MSAAADLLAWYDAHRRDLPWRRDRDPYRVWVSEVMLQQTRVETVLPYYERFLRRFPGIAELAAAEVDEVLTLWSGLGYYRRARQLHAAARQVAAAGGFPDTVEGLRRLPGIGAYTAAAVASIAFGVAEPVLDGNVERVAARYGAHDVEPKSAGGRRQLAETARRLLDPERPGDGNQALMELGATRCTPRRPRCPLCPLRGGCIAGAGGDAERYPPPRRRRAVERVRLAVAVVAGGDGVLLYRRPDDSRLLAGTWELPWFELASGQRAARVGPAELARRYGGRWHLGRRLAKVRHGITHRDLTVEAHRAELEAGAGNAVAEGPEAGWFTAAERRRLPLSSLVEKVLSAAGTLSEDRG